MGQTRRGEDGDLLSTSDGVHHIECRDTRLNHLLGVDTGVRIDGHALSSQHSVALGVVFEVTGVPSMSRYSWGRTLGPLSMGFPDPLKMRPTMSEDTGKRIMSPENSTWASRTSIPVVPSKTCRR